MTEKDEKLQIQEMKIEESENKRKEYIKNMIILGAYYPSIDNRAAFYVDYKVGDSEEVKTEIVRTAVENDMLNRVLEVFTYDEILAQTQERQDALVRVNQDFQQFVEWKKEGKISTDFVEKEPDTGIDLETIETMSTEDLFKLKLAIFEKEEVQNSENRELRSSIRKSKDAIELLHHYFEIKLDAQKDE
tara:strand:- start:1027 stop:1593 length:567 start_codon:yes stop_codon:yes gene_type:complete